MYGVCMTPTPHSHAPFPPPIYAHVGPLGVEPCEIGVEVQNLGGRPVFEVHWPCATTQNWPQPIWFSPLNVGKLECAYRTPTQGAWPKLSCEQFGWRTKTRRTEKRFGVFLIGRHRFGAYREL